MSHHWNMATITHNLTEAQVALIIIGILVGLLFFYRVIWWVIAGLFVAAVVGAVFPEDPMAGWLGSKAAALLVPLLPVGIFSFGLRVMFRGFRKTNQCSHHHCSCSRH